MKRSKYDVPRNNGDDSLGWRIAAVGMIFAASVFMAILAGCVTLRGNSSAELKASAEIFAATVNVLTELKAQGQLGDDEIEDIGAMIHLGEKYLLEWRAAIDADEPDADARAAFRMIVEELMKVRSKHNGNS